MNKVQKASENLDLRVVTLVLDNKQSEKFFKFLEMKYVFHKMTLIGKGTVKHQVLNMLGITDQKRILIQLLMEYKNVKPLVDLTVKKLNISKPGCGIIYVSHINTLRCFSDHERYSESVEINSEENSMYKKLTIIVERGNADEVMDIARKAGVKGGTLIHGRGTGSEKVVKLFGTEIEPEKEVIIILLPTSKVDKVVDSLTSELNFEEVGGGIMYVESVCDVKGLVEEK